jgi:hypothetical protein
LFKNYFFSKYQPRAEKRKVIGGVGLQTHPRSGFLELPMKTSLRDWHRTWFYCENHEPNHLAFLDRLPEYQGTWHEEPTPAELPLVAPLSNRINDSKAQGLTGDCVAANWLARQVMPLKKQVHPRWEYRGFDDPTREVKDKIKSSELIKLLEEMFQDTRSWPTAKQVRTYHLGMERDSVRQSLFSL